MATINYQKRLQNLQNRRFDKDLNESALTKSFSTSGLPENIKYLVESMQPIDRKYNTKTVTAANNVRNHLEAGYNLHFKRVYATQGSVMSRTNIKVHSDIDLLTVIDHYFYPQGQPVNPYRDSDPNSDIKELRRQSVSILKRQYDIVDDSGDKSISIVNQNLNRKVDIVPCFWYKSDKYFETNNEHYKGVYLFDFSREIKLLDYPFATINNLNNKGDSTNDGFRRGVRLLKTLKADCDASLQTLKSFQLTTIVYSINEMSLNYYAGNELNIARAISMEMQKLIDDSSYRCAVRSANGMETPLNKAGIVTDIKRLKEDLDQLIIDAASDVRNSLTVQRNILTY